VAATKDAYQGLLHSLNEERSYWIPGSSAPTLPEKGKAFLRPLKKKGFEEERVTTMRIYTRRVISHHFYETGTPKLGCFLAPHRD
jgi:hypothetical protein